jgi:nucleoside-diphosphate-sugar epimerase
MESIFISGANGCIGSSIVKRLVSLNYSILALSLNETDSNNIMNFDKVKIEFGDICDTGRIEKIFFNNPIDTVIHLAAIVHKTAETDEEYKKVNYQATVDLYELSKKYRVKHFIFFSTVAVYGDDIIDIVNETSNIKPESSYAISKAKAEEYIQKNSINSIKYTIIRPTTVYGPNDKGNINTMYQWVTHGIVPIIGDGNNQKSFVFVENLVDSIVTILKSKKIKNQIFIISDKSPYSINSIFQTMEQVIGKKIIKIHIPNIFISIIILLVKILNFITRKKLINPQSISKLYSNNIYDISKARTLLNYNPKISLEDGLCLTYKKQKKETSYK